MMLLSEAAGYMDGEFLSNEEAWVTCVGSDSRHITQNELFFALKGDNFDGHQYAEQAIKQGATAAVIANKDCKVRPAILVEDTKRALGRLAAAWRATFTLPLVAVTGSNGKTTVKEMLAAILNTVESHATDKNASASRAVLATQGNLNNDIGMPMTLLKLNAQHKFAVIEMGMNHLGEIDYLTRIAQPNVAVINNAGTAHIGELGSRENIAKAKGEIFAGLSSGGIAVINADDAFADYWKSLNPNRKILTFGLNSKADVTATYEEVGGASEITLNTRNGSITFNLAMLGKHNVSNALAASACAVALGVANADIARGLKQFGGVKGRLQRKVGLNGANLIDDTYNANPDSMKAAIDVLAAQAGKQIFVMGDMAELGVESAQMHAEIGAYAKQKGIAQMLALGDMTKHSITAFGTHGEHFASLQALLDEASRAMQKNTTILIKGSRFMQMERLVDALEEKLTKKQMKEDA
jgi:UDP-N-acetylmuramoyl-tripeptide--D-alanyl-D-alanine ligase